MLTHEFIKLVGKTQPLYAKALTRLPLLCTNRSMSVREANFTSDMSQLGLYSESDVPAQKAVFSLPVFELFNSAELLDCRALDAVRLDSLLAEHIPELFPLERRRDVH